MATDRKKGLDLDLLWATLGAVAVFYIAWQVAYYAFVGYLVLLFHEAGLLS